ILDHPAPTAIDTLSLHDALPIFAHADAAPVQRGATAAAGGEFFLAHRVQYHRVLQAALVLAGDAYGKMRHAAQEVGGAVQRVDDPLVVRPFALAGDLAGLFALEAVVGVGLAQQIDDALLGGKVDLADVILGFLLVGRDGVQAFDGAEDQFTGAARSAQGDVQHGLHGEDTWAVKESRESYQKAAPGVSAHWPANAHAGVRRCAPAWRPAMLIG